MENIVLIVHLLFAAALILTVLVQRSEGGGLGIGGGGGGGMSGRPAASPVSKFTWILAIAFLVTSLSLNWLGRYEAAGSSVIDRLGAEGSLLPPPPAAPGIDTDGLLPPPPVDAPLAPPPAN